MGSGESQRSKLSGIEQVDDAAAIESVAGQSVRVPSEYTPRLPPFNPIDHRIEDWAARPFCGLFLNQFVNDVEPLAACQFPEFGDLIIDASDLPREVVGRLPSVDKKAVVGIVNHVATLARNLTSAKGSLSTAAARPRARRLDVLKEMRA